MLTKKSPDLTYADVTPRALYMGRRNFLLGLAATAGAVLAYKKLPRIIAAHAAGNGSAPVKLPGVIKWPCSTTEPQTPENDVTHYNNFYEFGTGKEDPAAYAKNFVTTPWSVSVEGEVKKPRKFSMDEILKLAPLEERIYRHRCVEAWSIVVPWIGYSFSTLTKLVEPTSKAKYVAFQSYYDARQMPQGAYAGIDLPYVEGLRLDEAMHPLTLLCVGMYGETLPNQDGAPVRLVIPWKYGFKSIKSLVKIRFVEQQPPTTWNIANAHEYGFYSNVNPNVDHPRWSQAKERRLGEFFRRPTLMFNGYSDQVASLYNGMDLKKYY
ncbi:MAG TPA: protein-methionine-sulfoxide reductase catalytic subunit MsrP [Candidatus Sulfotelmatobacter sp.]|nr:protein-methionine-sulfoxide reductase catalytic subunit MsrP [Candidatus Sulfotelmatobacter sp.]